MGAGCCYRESKDGSGRQQTAGPDPLHASPLWVNKRTGGLRLDPGHVLGPRPLVGDWLHPKASRPPSVGPAHEPVKLEEQSAHGRFARVSTKCDKRAVLALDHSVRGSSVEAMGIPTLAFGRSGHRS